MILKPKHNIAVSSVSTDAASALLTAYREWTSNESATAAELYNFITNQSAERRAFLSTVNITSTVNANYIIQKIN